MSGPAIVGPSGLGRCSINWSRAHSASIPSPSDSVLHLGPIPLHMYGLMIAIGVLVAVAGRPDAVRPQGRYRRSRDPQATRRGLRHRRVLGRDRRDHRRAPLPRDHRLPAVQRSLGAHGPDLEGRPRHLGRGRRRRDRGVVVGRRRRPRASPTSPTASLRDSCSRRRSAGGATGSTRSCSAARRRCRGRSRSTPRTVRPDTRSYATFQPTFLYESLWCLALGLALLCVDRKFKLVRGPALRAVLAWATRRSGCRWRRCASTRRTPSVRCAQRVGEHRRVHLRRPSGSSGSRHGAPRTTARRIDDGSTEGSTAGSTVVRRARGTVGWSRPPPDQECLV